MEQGYGQEKSTKRKFLRTGVVEFIPVLNPKVLEYNRLPLSRLAVTLENSGMCTNT